MSLKNQYESTIKINNDAIEQYKSQNRGCIFWFVILAIGLLIFNKFIGGIFIFIYGIGTLNIVLENNKHIDRITKDTYHWKGELQKELNFENSIRIQKEKTVFEKNFKVKGISFYKDNLNELIGILVKSNDYWGAYNGYTNKEIEEFADRVYKYSGCESKNIQFIKEPDNPNDENAIKIYIENLHIGYVPKELSAEINQYIDNKDYSIKSRANIVGGTYKQFNYLEDKVVTIRDEKIGIKIYFSALKDD